jgi:Tol biopolymer transport system component
LTFDDSYTHGLAWTADGREIVFSSHRAGECNLWRVSASGGNPQRVVGGIGGHDHYPAVSRQGRRLIFDRYTEDVDIWRVEAPDSKGAAKPAAKFIASTRHDADPEYSPDGTQIAFTSDRSGAMQVWLCNSDGSNPVQLTSFGGPGAELSSWSPDGQYIAFNSLLKGNWDIYVISAKGGAARQLTTHRAEDTRPSWSRDGRWIYFSSTRTGAFQVWKVPAEGGAPVQVTKNGGHRPIESVDGKFVYYAKGREAKDIWRVPAQGGEEVLILPVKRPSAWTTVVENGLYFFDEEEGARPGGGWWIKFLDFGTGRTRPVVALDEDRVVSDISPYSGSAAVSLDGRSFLYTPMDLGESDLMLVENFQ